jgi:hypothetical protein
MHPIAAIAFALAAAAAPKADLTPDEAYDRQYLHFQEITVVNQYGRELRRTATVIEGKYRKPVDDRDFYVRVGRADLASAYDTR